VKKPKPPKPKKVIELKIVKEPTKVDPVGFLDYLNAEIKNLNLFCNCNYRIQIHPHHRRQKVKKA